MYELKINSHAVNPNSSTKMELAEIRAEGDRVIYTQEQNIGPTLAHNKEVRDKHSEENWAAGRKTGTQWVARIPGIVFWDMLKQGILEDQAALNRALELNKELKVTNKRLI